jgi:hypothetical protein
MPMAVQRRRTPRGWILALVIVDLARLVLTIVLAAIQKDMQQLHCHCLDRRV